MERSHVWPVLALGIALGVAGTLGTVRLLDSPREAPQAAEALDASRAAPPATAEAPEPRKAAEPPALAGTPRSPPPPGEPLADLPPERARQAAEIARAIRRESEQRLRDADRIAATQVRQEMAAERRFLEDQARGGTMTLLKGLKSDVPMLDLVGSRSRFAEMFERKAPGPTSKSVPSPGEPLPDDGTTILLGPGVVTWKVSAWQHSDRFPADLLVEGAGMDETLLVLDEIRSRGEVRSLTFHDLTIDCSDNYLTDLRQEPITLRLERVRVVGFDMGAGGSSMLNARQAAFYATDCRIEACFGRAPGFGNLFDVRGGLLARLEGCVIVGPFRSVGERSGNATVVFSRCRFEHLSPPALTTAASPALRFEDCVWEPSADPAADRSPARRSLTEVNSAWDVARR